MDGSGFSFSYSLFTFAELETEPDGTGERALEISFQVPRLEIRAEFSVQKKFGKETSYAQTWANRMDGWDLGFWRRSGGHDWLKTMILVFLRIGVILYIAHYYLPIIT